ncbi:MAG: TraB/GumN family protein [Xanthomonadales bacterium]|nr:TraB/GumN family protein [Xanthomonadales bacterium]
MRTGSACLISFLLFFVGLLHAAENGVIATPPRNEATTLETLVVTGVMPGPGLWKVHHEGHTMWILGYVQPVAKRLQWESAKVEAVVVDSQAILYPPYMKIETGMGMMRSLLFLPRLIGVRKNPDGRKLVDQVSAEDYARWLVLKKKFLGRDRGVEKQRPLFAAEALYKEALDDSGLELRGLISPLVDKLAKKHKIPVERPHFEVVIEDPKAALAEFRKAEIDDAACFRKTLDNLESDLETIRQRANAWATGDMITLRQVTYENRSSACFSAFLESDIAKHQGITDLKPRLEKLWLDAAEKMLAEHAHSFAVLPMEQLVSEDGYLAKLKARGYEVEEP